MIILLKTIVLILIVLIFFALGSALYYLSHSNSSEKIVKALTWRISLSLILFIFIVITLFLLHR